MQNIAARSPVQALQQRQAARAAKLRLDKRGKRSVCSALGRLRRAEYIVLSIGLNRMVRGPLCERPTEWQCCLRMIKYNAVSVCVLRVLRGDARCSLYDDGLRVAQLQPCPSGPLGVGCDKRCHIKQNKSSRPTRRVGKALSRLPVGMLATAAHCKCHSSPATASASWLGAGSSVLWIRPIVFSVWLARRSSCF